jgi:hypothetical protein
MPIYLQDGDFFTARYCYRYQYDKSHRMTSKQIPGQDRIDYEYDAKDRLIYMQDGNLRTTGSKKYFLYDELNRKVEEGVKDNADNLHPKVITNYDNYDFNNNGSDDYHYISDPDFPDNVANLNAKGMETGSKVAVDEDLINNGGGCSTPWETSCNFYDKYGRVLQKQVYIDCFSIDIYTFQLDFTGKVLKSKQGHYTLQNGTPNNYHSIVKNYMYDHAGRLITLKQKIDQEPERVVVENQYNEIGQLSAKLLGRSQNKLSALQTVDYAYNERGWLKSINQPNLSANGCNDLFGMTLLYDRFDNATGMTSFVPQYNGNISAARWKSKVAAVMNGYEYHYDDLGRITDAIYLVNEDGDWAFSDHYRESNFTYDKNGNILSANRMGSLKGSYSEIDKLHYLYQGNQLIVVDDDVDDNHYYDFFENGNKNSSSMTGPGGEGTDMREYLYDANGNMIADRNKGIVNITYNELNTGLLPVACSLYHTVSIQDAQLSRPAQVFTARQVLTQQDADQSAVVKSFRKSRHA